jgi:hypothetical protein
MRLLLIIGGLTLIGLIVLLPWFTRTPPAVVARLIRTTGLGLAIGLLLLLTATGRLDWLLALIGALAAVSIRLLPLLPLLRRLWIQMWPTSNGARSSAPNRSTVEARFVRMSLDHDSGEMSGVVLEGTFAGKQLHELDLEDLLKLFQECRMADEESAALIQAYLDRVHGEGWRAKVGARTDYHPPPGAGKMTREEACQVLGLAPGASREEIIEAHRRLMQKLHPDRGGSDYLAAMINRAKDMLLGK